MANVANVCTMLLRFVVASYATLLDFDVSLLRRLVVNLVTCVVDFIVKQKIWAVNQKVKFINEDYMLRIDEGFFFGLSIVVGHGCCVISFQIDILELG